MAKDEFEDFDNFDFGDESDVSEAGGLSDADKSSRETATSHVTETGKAILDDFKDTPIMDQAEEVVTSAFPAVVGNDGTGEIISHGISEFNKATKELKGDAGNLLDSIESIDEEGFIGDAARSVKGFLGIRKKKEENVKSDDELANDFAGSTVSDNTEAISNMAKLMAETTAKSANTSNNLMMKSNEIMFTLLTKGIELDTKYYRASLQLAFKGGLEGAKQTALLLGIKDELNAKLSAIEHNTTLPDIIKARSMEAIKHQMLLNTIGDHDLLSVIDSSTTLNKMKKSVTNKVGMAKDSLQAMLGFGNDAVLMGLDMKEQMQDGGGHGMAGGLIGSSIRSRLGSLLGRGIAKTKYGRDIKSEAKQFMLDPTEYLNNKEATSEHGVVKFGAKMLGKLFTDEDSKTYDSFSTKNMLPESVMSFDKRTHDSINIVIPTLLSKLLGEVTSIRECSNCINVSKGLKYDYLSGKFVTKDSAKDVFKTTIKKTLSKTNDADITDKLFEELGDDFTDDEKATLKSELTKQAYKGGVNLHKLVSKGFTGSKIDSKLLEKFQNGLLNLKDDKIFDNYGTSLVDINELVRRAITEGNGDMLVSMGYITHNELNDSFELVMDENGHPKILDLIGDTSKGVKSLKPKEKLTEHEMKVVDNAIKMKSTLFKPAHSALDEIDGFLDAKDKKEHVYERGRALRDNISSRYDKLRGIFGKKKDEATELAKKHGLMEKDLTYAEKKGKKKRKYNKAVDDNEIVRNAKKAKRYAEQKAEDLGAKKKKRYADKKGKKRTGNYSDEKMKAREARYNRTPKGNLDFILNGIKSGKRKFDKLDLEAAKNYLESLSVEDAKNYLSSLTLEDATKLAKDMKLSNAKDYLKGITFQDGLDLLDKSKKKVESFDYKGNYDKGTGYLKGAMDKLGFNGLYNKDKSEDIIAEGGSTNRDEYKDSNGDKKKTTSERILSTLSGLRISSLMSMGIEPDREELNKLASEGVRPASLKGKLLAWLKSKEDGLDGNILENTKARGKGKGLWHNIKTIMGIMGTILTGGGLLTTILGAVGGGLGWLIKEGSIKLVKGAFEGLFKIPELIGKTFEIANTIRKGVFGFIQGLGTTIEVLKGLPRTMMQGFLKVAIPLMEGKALDNIKGSVFGDKSKGKKGIVGKSKGWFSKALHGIKNMSGAKKFGLTAVAGLAGSTIFANASDDVPTGDMGDAYTKVDANGVPLMERMNSETDENGLPIHNPTNVNDMQLNASYLNAGVDTAIAGGSVLTAAQLAKNKMKKKITKKVSESAVKNLEKKAAKKVGKSILKKIPGIGTAFDLASGVYSLFKGDYKGAAKAAGDAVSSVFLPLGIAMAAMDIYDVGKDVVDIADMKDDKKKSSDKDLNLPAKFEEHKNIMEMAPTTQVDTGAIMNKPKKGSNHGRTINFSTNKGIKHILEGIAKHESAQGDAGYEITYGNGRFIDKNTTLTDKTISEIYDIQNGLVRGSRRRKARVVSSAVGKYQFIRKTLKEMVRLSKIPLDTLFDKHTQDMLIVLRLKQLRKLNEWVNGDISNRTFIHHLSLEFASIEDPYIGRGHYDKQGNAKNTYVVMNKVLNEAKKMMGIPFTYEDNDSTHNKMVDSEVSNVLGENSDNMSMGDKAVKIGTDAIMKIIEMGMGKTAQATVNDNATSAINSLKAYIPKDVLDKDSKKVKTTDITTKEKQDKKVIEQPPVNVNVDTKETVTHLKEGNDIQQQTLEQIKLMNENITKAIKPSGRSGHAGRPTVYKQSSVVDNNR